MRKIISMCMALVVMLGLTSCNPSESAINKLESLVNKIEANHETFTDAEWVEAAESFEIIVEELDNYAFTEEELKEIGRMKGKCMGYFTKQSIKNFEKELEEISSELEGGFEGFFEVFTEE